MALSFPIWMLLTIIAFSSSVLAADTGQILQQERQLQQFQDLPTAIPESLIIEDNQKSNEDTGPKVFIKNINFSGNQVFTDEELLDVIQDFINQELSFNQMQLLTQALTNFYQDQGYFLAQAILPKQEISNDTIKIIIQEGSLDPNQPLMINDSGSVGFHYV